MQAPAQAADFDEQSRQGTRALALTARAAVWAIPPSAVINSLPVTRVRARTRVFGFALAMGLPIAIGAAFGHPVHRVLVPESIMLAIAVLLSLLDGVAVGLL